MNAMEFRRALRTDLKYRFSSYGSYPVLLVMSDGGCLCQLCAHAEKARIHEACRTGARDGWKAEGAQVNWEDPELFCDHCNARIESAYAEPESADQESGR